MSIKYWKDFLKGIVHNSTFSVKDNEILITFSSMISFQNVTFIDKSQSHKFTYMQILCM